MLKTETEYRQTPIKEIKPYEGNPRIIPQHAIDSVAKSIKEFGFRGAIIVDKDGVILAGHTRYLAALKLGLSSVPVLWNYSITPEQAKAYRIADNKTSELSSWDDEALEKEVKELASVGNIDLKALALDPWELEKILSPIIKPEQEQEQEPEPEQEQDIPDIYDCFATIYWSSKDEEAKELAIKLFGTKARFFKQPLQIFLQNTKKVISGEP